MNLEDLGQISDEIVQNVSSAYNGRANLPIKEKVRIMLDQQKPDYHYVIKTGKPHKWWEKPWDVEP